MAQIQPISTWYQGEIKQANVFNLYCSFDNLIDSATFKYQLIELIITPDNQKSQTLIFGELAIYGFDYEAWNASTDTNSFIYTWATQKLNLVLIP
jgi:hypothetical protein